MAELPSVFKASEAPEDIGVLEPGWYLAEITHSDVKHTKAQDGQYINLGFKVIEERARGAMVWTNLNIINKNPVAVEIAQKQFRKLCEAVSTPVVSDTGQLHGKPLRIKVSVTPESDMWPAKNEVKDFKPADGSDSDIDSNEFSDEIPF